MAAAAMVVALGCAGGSAGSPPAAAAPAPSGAGRVAPAKAPAITPAEAHRRADAALEGLIRGFWNGAAFTTTWKGSQGAPYWLNAQALDAVLDGVERTGGRWADVARAFIADQDARGWHSDYFDDENWMALALLRAAELLGDATLVGKADALLDDIVKGGSDATCCGTRPGGLWWDAYHTQKATASNAGPVITAVRLYERTGDTRRLELARQLFAYWYAEMVDPVTGQVADHVESDGRKVWWRFTYNEGTMIGAALALHEATGEASYLEAARKVGAFMVASETTPSEFGGVLTDGASCDGDCDQFKGIAQRYLAALAEADPGGGWDALVVSNGLAVWTVARGGDVPAFGVDWAGPTPREPTVASQSSAAMGLDRAARALGPYVR
jgi:predicted alpha-1,6-mannanase (GH76 family)